MNIYTFYEMTVKIIQKLYQEKISSLKSLYKYLTKNVMLINNDPTVNLELPIIKKSLPKYLTLEQSEKLWIQPQILVKNHCVIIV